MYELVDRSSFGEEVGPIAPMLPEFATTTRLALIGGFTPRRCGIATFTADIFASLAKAAPRLAVDVYAMTPQIGHTIFDPGVSAVILDCDRGSYIDAANLIDASGADVVWLQHEFGLFAGPAGDMVLELVDRIAAPLIVTLHTVLAKPDDAQMHVMQRLIAHASKLVVMSERSRELLDRVYHVDARQIIVIPHGVPDRPFGRTAKFKTHFGFDNRNTIMTFGLLSPGKGIEVMIAALPAIIAAHPDTLYCIAGATHPNLVQREGEAYRDGLHALAKSLGVEDHIRWFDAFLETEELLDLIEAADVYVTPYPGAAQSTSGTLSYAMALGKAVVSTPYVHAVELLADDHGILVPFNDSGALAHEITALFDDPARRLALQQRAYDRGRDMVWPAFAARCLDLIENTRVTPRMAPKFGAIGIGGLLRICDDTGILQHSIHNVPDRAHGYCIDDNARALMLMNRLGDDDAERRDRLTLTFAAFVQGAWNNDTRQFRNFMGYARNWLEDMGSEDSCGRAIWALGATAHESRSPALRQWARELFDRTASSALGFGSPRAIAFAMLGADCMLAHDNEHRVANDILVQGATRLLTLYTATSKPGWRWFETLLAYDNCRLSEAMIRAGMRLDRLDFSRCGMESLRWMMKVQTAPAGHFRPVGSNSFGRQHELPLPFDQQPVEIWAAIDAAAAAYDFTGDSIWLAHATRAYDWFYGANDRGVVVADVHSGTCRDGINPHGLNLNEGAESVLAFQHSHLAMRAFSKRVGQD